MEFSDFMLIISYQDWLPIRADFIFLERKSWLAQSLSIIPSSPIGSVQGSGINKSSCLEPSVEERLNY
jgi:hypothetical protein